MSLVQSRQLRSQHHLQRPVSARPPSEASTPQSARDSYTKAQAENCWASYLGLESGEDDLEEQEAPPRSASSNLQMVKHSESSKSRNLSHPAPGLSQSLKRKASNDVWPRTAPLKSTKSRYIPQPHPADTITIDGEVYDRRKRPGSINEQTSEDLDLHVLPYQQSYYLEYPAHATYSPPARTHRDAFNSYRCPSPSNISAVTYHSPPRQHYPMVPSHTAAYNQLFDYDDTGSVASGASYAFPSRLSAVGGLASPTAGMRLGSSVSPHQDGSVRSPAASPKRPKLALRTSAPASTNSKPSGHAAASPPDQRPASATSQPPPPLLPIPAPSPPDVAESTSTGSSNETKPKAKRVRKRAPPKGTPQVAMSSNPNAPVHVARPPNAWILYRSDQLRIIKQDPVISKKPQADISKLIGALWREEKPEVKLWYEQQADIKKSEHLKQHPGACANLHLDGLSDQFVTEYRFAPQRKDKGRSAGNGNAGKSTISWSSSSSNNIIPVAPSKQTQSVPESTPASTPTSGVSPPHESHMSQSLQQPQLQHLYPSQPHHGPGTFQYDNPEAFTASPHVVSSGYTSAPVARFTPYSPHAQVPRTTGIAPQATSAPVVSGQAAELYPESTAANSSNLTALGLELDTDVVWADFLTCNADKSWLPYATRSTPQSEEAFIKNPSLSIDRTLSNESWPSPVTCRSNVSTPLPVGYGLDREVTVADDQLHWFGDTSRDPE